MTRELTLTGSASWNRSELYKEVTFNDKAGNPIDFEALGLHNPYGTKGSPLAQSPPFQMNCTWRGHSQQGSPAALRALFLAAIRSITP